MSLTLKETAQELGLDLLAVVEMVSRGELKPFSQHGRTYFSEQDILEYQTLQRGWVKVRAMLINLSLPLLALPMEARGAQKLKLIHKAP